MLQCPLIGRYVDLSQMSFVRNFMLFLAVIATIPSTTTTNNNNKNNIINNNNNYHDNKNNKNSNNNNNSNYTNTTFSTTNTINTTATTTKNFTLVSLNQSSILCLAFYDILCRVTFVIVCHKMVFMTDVIWHKVSWTIAIWVSNEPSRLVQLIYSIQNHFLFWFLDKNSKYQNANISLCNSLSKTKRPKMRMKVTSNHFRPLAKCF